MGKIDDSIMANYRKALTEGNLAQASRAVKLAKSLKWFIETENFVDYPSVDPENQQISLGSVFKPVSYKYFKETGIVVFFRSTINLTQTENRLFDLLTQNETSENEVKVIKTENIRKSVWSENSVSANAVRILIKRLRLKIEPDPYRPQILLNFNKKGYIFIAQREL